MSGTIARAVVVLGATGTVGRGVVGAALGAGRPVLAVARDRVALASLAEAHPGADLALVVGSVADDAGSALVAGALAAAGRPLAGVVDAIAGPPVRGRLLDQPASTLCGCVAADVVAHLAAARALLPLLAHQAGAAYVLVGGPGSTTPWAGYGHRSVAAASLRMLVRVLHDEARPLGVRVQLLSVETPVARDRNASPQWPTAETIGRRALALLDQRARAAHDAIEPAAPRWLQDARALLQGLTPSIPTEVPPHETP